jgi:FkbM family methyltransferase
MRFLDRLHMYHRVWRYRLVSERDELSFVLSRDLRGATVVDIGANRGIYSYWLHRKVGPQGRVIAFEPQPELAQWLTDFKRSFGLSQLEIVGQGLSSACGESTLVRPRQHWGAASLERTSAADCDVLHIPLTTLDHFFSDARYGPVRLIKCDVEGHEDSVFRGGARLLARDHPDLLFEYKDPLVSSGSTFPLLQELGYRGYFFFRRRLVPLSRYHELRPQIKHPYLNFVFMHQPNDARTD